MLTRLALIAAQMLTDAQPIWALLMLPCPQVSLGCRRGDRCHCAWPQQPPCHSPPGLDHVRGRLRSACLRPQLRGRPRQSPTPLQQQAKHAITVRALQKPSLVQAVR